MTSPLYTEDEAHLPAAHADESGERLHRVEEEVAALRDTVARFAELVLNELKRIHPSETAQLEKAAESIPPGEPPPFYLPPSPPAAPPNPHVGRGWVLPELFRDVTTTFKMYLDSRYRLRRTTQLFVPVVLFLFVINHIFWNAFPVPIVDRIFETLTDIILAVLLYKVLQREMIRYRDTISAFNIPNPGGGTRILHADAEGSSATMDIER